MSLSARSKIAIAVATVSVMLVGITASRGSFRSAQAPTPIPSASTPGSSSGVIPSSAVAAETSSTAEEADAGGKKPNFDDPTDQWPTSKKIVSEKEATGEVKFRPILGKKVSNGEKAILTTANGDLMVHYKKNRVFIYQSSSGYFSNNQATQFVKDYAPGASKLGTTIELVDLGSGFLGVLIAGDGSTEVQFGTDSMIVQVVVPPGASSRSTAVRLAMEAVGEVAETSPPGTAPADTTPVKLAETVPIPTLPPTTADPHPATGINPP